MDISSCSEEVFSTIGKNIPHFEVREGQLRMYEDVLQAYHNNSTYLIEAGTGTGKSLAYLLPALLWVLEHQEPTIIATNTIALQEQLMQKEIPFLLKALDLDIKAVLMKGMQNYVCLRKLYDAQHEVPESVLHGVKNAVEGSRSELPILPSQEVWEQIGAEAESCTYQRCPHYKECFYFKARKQAADAHIIVANHHLLFADLTIREESDNYNEAAVLPSYSRLIIDEAHHIEEVATYYYADKVSRRGLLQLLGRLLSDRGSGKLIALYRVLGEAYPNEIPLSDELTLLLPAEKRELVELLTHAFQQLATYSHTDEKQRLRDEHLEDPFWIEHVQPAVHSAVDAAKRFVTQIFLLEGKIKQIGDASLTSKCEGILAELSGICSRLEKLFGHLHAFVFEPLNPKRVRWIEGYAPDLHLVAADLEVGSRLSKALFDRLPTIILCSATLSTNRDFSFIRSRLGIHQAEERLYESPFNYSEQALLTVPTDLPDPGHPNFTDEAAKRIYEALQISQGGTFVLFTSYSMLRQCEHLLKERLRKAEYHLFCQGEESRSALLNKFRLAEKSVLFGTDSFWEGVDVVGEALRCVILVKLPFKAPNDPLFQARSEALALDGKSPFFEYALPHAIVKFKQGFGRLIRNKGDRGCVICLDPRLIKKGYGKSFLKSLPNCPTFFEPTPQVLSKVNTFFNALKN